MEYLAFEHAHHLSKEIHEVLWPEAWSDGHDYGFAEIEGYYLAAVDFANRILKASEK